jgi:hypothetical protein
MKTYRFHSAYQMDRFIRKHGCEDWLWWNGEFWEPYYPEVSRGEVQAVPVVSEGGTSSEMTAH